MRDLVERLRQMAVPNPQIKNDSIRVDVLAITLNEAAAEIERLQEAKRAALQLADERAKEVNELKQLLFTEENVRKETYKQFCSLDEKMKELEIAQNALTATLNGN